jgi:hypothetical protein
MILYAKKTSKAGYKDVLILDTPPKKKSLIKVISDTQKTYPWIRVVNLATAMPNESDFTVNTRKNITRKLKDNFFVKPVYDFLLKQYLKKQQKKESNRIHSQLADLGSVGEINIVTQTSINNTLFALYPKASVNYFEHGQGDYIFIQKINPINFNFYCVFSDKFKQYLTIREQADSYVRNLDINDFNLLAKEVIENDPDTETIKSLLEVSGKLVLILMENVQIYNVPDNFWTDYLDLCIEQIDTPEEYTFILKPHPGQSFKSIEISKEHMLTTRKLKTLVTESNSSISYSVEVLYSLWQQNTEHVFSLFSSGLFYISKLYRSDKAKYYYAYDFFKEYIKNAPPQISANYINFESLLKGVFTENCIEMSKQKFF